MGDIFESFFGNGVKDRQGRMRFYFIRITPTIGKPVQRDGMTRSQAHHYIEQHTTRVRNISELLFAADDSGELRTTLNGTALRIVSTLEPIN